MRLTKARKQFGKWKWILENTDDKLSVQQRGNLLHQNVISILTFNCPTRPVFTRHLTEMQSLVNEM